MSPRPARPRPVAPHDWLGTALLLGAIWVLGAAGPRALRADAGLRAADAHLRLDPNHASRQELALLPGIGPALSEAIVSYREQVGQGAAFRSADDLSNVRGIGRVTVARLRAHLRFDASRSGNQESSP